MISKVFLYYIVRVKDLASENPPIELVPVVREFPEVFPNELPRTTPEREINFVIDFLSDTNLISSPSYQMAPAKLKDLKDQLKDLLDKSFIRPIISPWGARYFFLKKKDGFL